MRFNSFASAFPGSNCLVIAEVKMLSPVAPTTNAPDVALRYVSPGSAFFIFTNQIDASFSAPGSNIPLIQFEDVPITTAIENIARQEGLNYILDPKIGYGLPDVNGRIKPEPSFSLQWKNLTPQQALLAILNEYGLQLIENPKTGIAQITFKSSRASWLYLPPADMAALKGIFTQRFNSYIVGSEGPLFFPEPFGQIHPLQIICRSEIPPSVDDLKSLFEQMLSGTIPHAGWRSIHFQSTGPDTVQVTVDAASANDYLRWSQQFDPDIELVREALKRPFYRMDGDYADPFLSPIPNFVTMRSLVQMLAQRAQCYLLLGQPEKALAELTLLNDSRRILEGAPTGKPMSLVAALIDAAVASVYVNTLAQIQQKKTWLEPQLAVLQSQLEQMNLTPVLMTAFKSEQARTCRIIDLNLFHHSWPRGWSYQNMVTSVNLEQRFIDGINPKDNLVEPYQINAVDRDINEMGNHLSPYTDFAMIFTLNFAPAIHTFTFDQSMVNEAQIACALERYHIAHGEYPVSLDALVPESITKLPHDLIGGQPLHYHPTTDGRFILYSIGWNQTDDDGVPGTLDDVDEGDWVWQYPTL